MADNLASDPTSEIYQKALALFPVIESAYINRKEADEAIEEYWHIFNAEADDNQSYQGNTRSYIPAVRDAIAARAKRTVKQLFPRKYKHVEAVGSDPRPPEAQLSLLEHYIRAIKLKSICRTMLVSGDVTGQWNLYVDWRKTTRTVADLITRNRILHTVEGSEVELEDPEEADEEVEPVDVTTQGPTVVDFATEDLVVIPPTCNDIEDADITCIKLRISKSLMKKFIDEGTFVLTDAESDLSEWISDHKGLDTVNPPKQRTEAVGINTRGTDKYACVYEAHVRMKWDDGNEYLTYVYFAGETELIGIIKAPQWGQKRPIISAPVERVEGSFNGKSKVDPVKCIQWNLNDFWNMGQDSAMYSMMPIVMTDPLSNPNYAAMVLGLAAVWPVDPNKTKFQAFPSLWKDSVALCAAMKSQIWESLDVNEMMMGRMPAGRKNNQMVGSQQMEQSVAIMDAASRFEEEILNPLMERMFEYDTQYRDESIQVLKQGELGVRAAMTEIEPQQWGERYYFQWAGTSFILSMQLMQQQIATMNVLRGIPPQQLGGLTLNIAPILKMMVDNVFGPELGSQILTDDRNRFTIPADIEDEMMTNGIPAQVHPADDDVQHIPQHQKSAQATGDPQGLIRAHLAEHMKQFQAKQQAAMAAQQQQKPPGVPGVPGGARPGVPGTPRPGAQPAPQRITQNPPGAAQPDIGRG